MQVANGRKRMSFVMVFEGTRCISSFSDPSPGLEPLGYLDRRFWSTQGTSAISRAPLY